MPEIAQILRKHRISGREYMLTETVAMVTAMTDATLTDEVLRHDGRKEIPTIFMTGRDDGISRKRAARLGATAYLVKPFEDAVLLRAIRCALASTTDRSS